MHTKAKTNEYQQAYPNFEATPKAVIAAVAFALAMRLNADDPDLATAMLRSEWDALYQAGIVPNQPA